MSVNHFTFGFAEPKLVVLKHYGKKEVLGLIDSMEECYNQPFSFDPELLEARRGRTGSAIEPGHWSYGINVWEGQEVPGKVWRSSYPE